MPDEEERIETPRSKDEMVVAMLAQVLADLGVHQARSPAGVYGAVVGDWRAWKYDVTTALDCYRALPKVSE